MLRLRSRFAPASVVAPALVAAALASAPTGTARAQEAGPADVSLQRKTLGECVQAALARNVEVLSAGEDVNVADAERKEVRGKLAPKIHLDASYQRWNEAYVFSGFPIHDVNVFNFTATATEPITGLLAIYETYKVRELGVDVAAVKREVARRQAALHVVEGYYRLLEDERLTEVAAASVEQLTTQLKQANSFHANGTVSQDDVLRAELAVANAKQRLIQTRARVTLDRGRLAVLMGLPSDAPIDAQPLAGDQAPVRDGVSLDQAQKSAAAQRVEIREVEKRIAQADRNTKIAYLKLAPQIDVLGSYIHNEGSLFSQLNAAYFGAVASWDVWDWGTTTNGIAEAKARARQALLAETKVREQVELEVRQAFVGIGTANEAMDVAKASVAAAEENFRLVKKRYDASAATSFDVVDAEGLLTQARGQMQTALYDFMIARAALHAATGASPEALARD